MQMITAATFIRAAINPGPGGEGGGCYRRHRRHLLGMRV